MDGWITAQVKPRCPQGRHRDVSGEGAECPRPPVVSATCASRRRHQLCFRDTFHGFAGANLGTGTPGGAGGRAERDRAPRPAPTAPALFRRRLVSGQSALPEVRPDLRGGGAHAAVPAAAAAVEAAEVRACFPRVHSRGKGPRPTGLFRRAPRPPPCTPGQGDILGTGADPRAAAQDRSIAS